MASNLAGLVVTFVALPGAGKTTLCARVAQILRQRGASCQVSDEIAFTKLRNKLPWIVREIVRHPSYAFRSMRAIVATRQESFTNLTRMIVNWLCRSFVLRRAARAGRIHLFDEGIFQALWSIGFTARKEAWPSRLPPLDPLMLGPGLTVVIESNLDTIRHRLATRTGRASRLEELLPDDAAQLPRAARVLEVVKETIDRVSAQAKPLRVLTIDNDRPDALEANARRIADTIQAMSDEMSVVSQEQWLASGPALQPADRSVGS